ncbi:MAG: hypothetical protein D6756_02050, partial [Cyanobacteria bacterium J083]
MESNASNLQLIKQTIALICSYGFEQQEQNLDVIIQQWLITYEPEWLLWATIEALYQGRYKIVSINQILQVWARKGKVRTSFTSEFELLISHRLPQELNNSSSLLSNDLASLTQTDYLIA